MCTFWGARAGTRHGIHQRGETIGFADDDPRVFLEAGLLQLTLQ